MALSRNNSRIQRQQEAPQLFSWPDTADGEDDAILGFIPRTPKHPIRSCTFDSVADVKMTNPRDPGYSHSAPESSVDLEHEDFDRQVSVISPRITSINKPVRRNGSLSRPHDRTDSHMDDNETREIIKLRQELAAVKHGLEKVLLTCSKLEEEKQEILEKWGEAADEMHKMKTERNYNQDDRYFKGAWGTLRYNIKNCTEQFFDKKSKISLFKAKDEFKRLSGDYDKYLMSDEHRPLLMQALVWHYLCDEIFGFGKPVSVNKWAGSGGTSFQSLSQNLRPVNFSSSLTSDYHRWRVATASLLHHSPDSKDKKVQMGKQLAQRLAEIMKPWLAGYWTHFLNYLQTIVEQAIALDTEMQKQTAHYYVHSWRLRLCTDSGRGKWNIPRHQEFEALTMDSLNEEPGLRRRPKPLSLVVSPALMKAGNAEGEDYSVCYAVVKATIVEQGGHAVQRSSSQASGNGRREPINDSNMAAKRSASAMSSNARNSDGIKVLNQSTHGSKSTMNKPKWRL